MQSTELDIDAALMEFEKSERARLGLDAEPTQHWRDAMIDPFFTASQRPTTTLLVGGLTMAHDHLVEGALKGRGYSVRSLDCPDYDSLRFGKEFGNRGQCNPTYFTVGNLVKELCRLRDEEGLSSAEVIERYVFLTAGACGPCRFGMYVTEYRKALRDAGFDGFRVLLFQQTGGFKQATGEELGLVLNPSFFMALARALFAGDVINLMQYRLRPYEVDAGATDRALAEVKRLCHEALEQNRSIVGALRASRDVFGAVKVDRSVPKPKVAVLGEFWAMTTEGDGNYHLQRFIEQEGGECEIQILANVLLYNLWELRHDTRERALLSGTDTGQSGLDGTDVGLKMAGLYLAEAALRSIFHTFAWAIGLRDHHLPNMDEIAAVGHSHYNQELRGGEGHMEVAKLILNVTKNKAHMTLSVKPFGCMPSSGVSDGVQSAITQLLPQAIFCAVETSGDGAVNFHSRVQMFLFKARQRAAEEYSQVLGDYGVTQEQVRTFLHGSSYGDSLHRAPHRAAGTAADLVHQVGPLVGQSRLGAARVRLGRAALALRGAVEKDLPAVMDKAREVAPYAPSLVRYVAAEASAALPSPKTAWNKLVERFVGLTPEEARQVAQAEAKSEATVWSDALPPRQERQERQLRVVA
jgi:predicted nucleotide-binding protein (sugar kinase/HSP70/actin superfamily)